MPSRAEWRVVSEHILRGVVIAALGVMLLKSLSATESVAKDDEIGARTLLGMLPLWSAMPTPPRRIDIVLDSSPAPLERDWLKALAAAGSRIGWSGDHPAVMIAAEPIASPVGGLRLRVAAPSGSEVELRDDAGVLDTVRARDAGASLVTSSVAGGVTARVKRSAAATILRDSVTLRKVLVIGNAGWESKFIIAALEEDGWKVDAFVPVAPSVDVTQGSIAAIDTSRYSAVVALDDAAAPYASRIVEFVKSGGGVVIAPPAAALDAMSSVRAGSPGAVLAVARGIPANSSVSLATLALSPITGLKNDAIALDKRIGAVAVAARRVGAGRALQFGYEDSWRWRMGGGENSLRDHRGWWTGLVSGVAYARRTPLGGSARPVDDAPVARLVAAIGPRSAGAGVAQQRVNPAHWMAWLFILLSFALIAEVASRRLRGAR